MVVFMVKERPKLTIQQQRRADKRLVTCTNPVLQLPLEVILTTLLVHNKMQQRVASCLLLNPTLATQIFFKLALQMPLRNHKSKLTV
jgi:hypothetical protein